MGKKGNVISLRQYLESKKEKQSESHYVLVSIENFEDEAKESLETFWTVTPPYVVEEVYERLLMKYLSMVAFVESNQFPSELEIGRYLRDSLSEEARRIYKSEPVFITTALDQLKIAETKRLSEGLQTFYSPRESTLPETDESD